MTETKDVRGWARERVPGSVVPADMRQSMRLPTTGAPPLESCANESSSHNLEASRSLRMLMDMGSRRAMNGSIDAYSSSEEEEDVAGPVADRARPSAGVTLSQVSKRFKGHTAVDDVTLSIPAGGILAIIGPSGAGKSTLLRCINFLETPTAGVITVAGRSFDVTNRGQPSAKELAELRRTVGMVFQSFNLFPHLTVMRNVSLPQERVLGRSRTAANARSRELLNQMGLADKVDQYPNRCSGGQQQRTAIARALALDPDVILFDEPTSALDPELGAEVLAAIKQLAHHGRTMIIVTHELRFAEDVADMVAVMVDGRLVEHGAPSEVLHKPKSERVARFIRAVER